MLLAMITVFSTSQLLSISLPLQTIQTYECETALSPEPVLHDSVTCI